MIDVKEWAKKQWKWLVNLKRLIWKHKTKKKIVNFFLQIFRKKTKIQYDTFFPAVSVSVVVVLVVFLQWRQQPKKKKPTLNLGEEILWHWGSFTDAHISL